MQLKDAQALTDAIVSCLGAGRRSAILFSDVLEHRVYNHAATETALRELALRHQQVDVRLLLRRSDRVLKGGDHALVELARQLPSRITILQADTIACEDEREWVVVDGRATVIRQQPDRYDAVYRDDDPQLARQLGAVFDRYWQQGCPAPELAQLRL